MGRRLAAADRLTVPLIVFVFLYVATLLLLTWATATPPQWAGLLSAIVATAVMVSWWEDGRWNLGLAAPASRAAAELCLGAAWGAGLVGVAALAVAALSDVSHAEGGGFPLAETLAVFLPAAVHEELVFRGYPFQKLRAWNRPAALIVMAIVFAALHTRNPAAGPIGLTNILLGGLLLALAYERYLRLWFPIGLHLAWNLMTGPVLGHEVSGYEANRTLLLESGGGPDWLTGGAFGLEGSIVMSAAELCAIAMLWKKQSRHDGSIGFRNPSGAGQKESQ